MPLIQDWMPPTEEHYNLILSIWKWFPVVSSSRACMPSFPPPTEQLLTPTHRLLRCNG